MDISPYRVAQVVNSQLTNWEFFKAALGTPKSLEEPECLEKNQLSHRLIAGLKYSTLDRQELNTTNCLLLLQCPIRHKIGLLLKGCSILYIALIKEIL